MVRRCVAHITRTNQFFERAKTEIAKCGGYDIGKPRTSLSRLQAQARKQGNRQVAKSFAADSMRNKIVMSIATFLHSYSSWGG
jgi:hypothetical protein